MILLDLMIPENAVVWNAYAKQHPREHSVVPLELPQICAKDSEIDKTLGLSLGADDYITKPFSVVEVLARIKANIRRRNQYDQGSEDIPKRLTAGELVMNLSDYTLTKSGRRVELTAKEYEVLKLLMQHPKKVYTKEQIYALVWKDAHLGDENAVNVHISRLRNKIEEDTTQSPVYHHRMGDWIQIGGKCMKDTTIIFFLCICIVFSRYVLYFISNLLSAQEHKQNYGKSVISSKKS